MANMSTISPTSSLPNLFRNFMRLPVEVRCIIYEFFFCSIDLSIHIHDEQCDDFCGDRKNLYKNTAILRTNKQIRTEARPFIYNADFHVYRNAFHGHMSLPTIPTQAATRIRHLVCWADVSYRALTHLDGLAVVGPLTGVRTVQFNLTWRSQFGKMAVAFRHFIDQDHPYHWVVEVKKVGKNGTTFRITINDQKEVVVVERCTTWVVANLVAFLAPLGLQRQNVVGNINYML